MLTQSTIQQIITITTDFWRHEVAKPDIAAIATGKEIGHRVADLVDERTTSLLEGHFRTARQRRKDGQPTARSMGDIWIYDGGLYNPVNVKSGEASKYGQPNMVSLKKLLRALLNHQIDSYYLLFVKLYMGDVPAAAIYMVDILEYLDFMHFDSGPGQIMLKERQFAEFKAGGGAPPVLSIDEKIQRLFDILEDADRRLMANRQKVRATIDQMREMYESSRSAKFDQSRLNLA